MKARLVFTKDCDKACFGCCMDNWVYDPPKLVTMEELREYDEILLTGGEPMLYPDELKKLINELRTPNNEIFLYTSLVDDVDAFTGVLDLLDGCSVTLHSNSDVKKFIELGYHDMNFDKKMRLNVFPKTEFDVTECWDFRPKKWLKDCPLPEKEELVSLVGEYTIDTKLNHTNTKKLIQV